MMGLSNILTVTNIFDLIFIIKNKKDFLTFNTRHPPPSSLYSSLNAHTLEETRKNAGRDKQICFLILSKIINILQIKICI
jgi:hypothetical protein